MRPWARQALEVVVLVVALCVAGLNGYASALACHAHVLSDGIHTHGGDDSDAGASSDAHHHHAAMEPSDADAGSQAADGPPPSDQPCKHVHVHCCATVAVPAGDCGLAEPPYARPHVAIADAHVPAGQLASPLFRPPRLSA